MNDKLNALIFRVAAGALILLGLIAVLVGYLGVREQADVVLQVPYFASGGIGGLGLILLGAVVLLWSQMNAQEQRFGSVVDSLEEWKEAALADVRHFLETAEVEVNLEDTGQRSSS